MTRAQANQVLDARRRGAFVSQANLLAALRITGDITPTMTVDKFRRPYRRPNFGSAA